MKPIFISGIGTDVGKTVVAAIVTEALGAVYWKPVQAGFDQGTDTEWVAGRLSDPRVLTETYKLAFPASPHIAARREGIRISLDRIVEAMPADGPLVVEGAGGLLVPLNEEEFVLDLVKRLDARVILVSRNYLGSINHSLLTAAVCRANGLDVAGWIFNDQYLDYEREIAAWSALPVIATIPFRQDPDEAFVAAQAERIRGRLEACLLASA
ncbi:dethiobiotin synthase [Flavitalea sp. BT771]|uniref:dethiobiotin synthase n=1 Tax=Flavitalea sp. BT771 TaxID=3063329 RepID=UPI0026E205AC|nr:dethiobiotin synthase [Flavitalea sp. BT771]MDO6434670.1 dethiobiotin synthase [Flavitalea sp. BT771]MDV6223570.1 dethiobiotin synthase [Flavitalea sp. BT771]